MIPQHKKFMLPILKICKDGGKFRRSELASILADQFKLTEAERNQLKSSGGERLLVNRIGWAAWYLKKAELLNGARGVFSITEDGKNIRNCSRDIGTFFTPDPSIWWKYDTVNLFTKR